MAEEREKRASRNRTITLTEAEQRFYKSCLIRLHGPVMLQEIMDRTICQEEQLEELFRRHIWFCTVSNDYTFNVEDVKLKRRVIAPYTNREGQPKDWSESENGRFRLTHPSNIWTDLTVPFWSMPENTDHPTQKPEKLLAKTVLASSQEGDVVLGPFLGSGTTSVVAKKLRRHYIGIEIDEFYRCLAERRLDMAEEDQRIQGYADGVFWERNTLAVLKSLWYGRRS